MLLLEKFEDFLNDSEDLLTIAKEECRLYHKALPYDDYIQQLEAGDILINFILNYDGSERDLIWWSGRLSLAKELEEREITIPLSDDDINMLREGQELHWTFGGIPQCLVVTDEECE